MMKLWLPLVALATLGPLGMSGQRLSGPNTSSSSAASTTACGYEKTSATVLTIFPGATAAAPCVVGDQPWQFTSPVEVEISGSSTSGTGYAYVDSSGNVSFAHNVATTFSVTGTGSVAAIGSTTAWPTNAARLFTPTWTANVWDAYDVAKDFRSPIASNRAINCTGCSAQSTSAAGAFEFTVPSGPSQVCEWSATGLTATSSTSQVTPCSIPAGTWTTGDSIQCRMGVFRDVVTGADIAQLTVSFVVSNGSGTTIAVHGGSASAASLTVGAHASNTMSAVADLRMVALANNIQAFMATGNGSAGAMSTGGTGTGGYGSLDISANAFTIEPRVWSTSGLSDDTWRFVASCQLTTN